jgi:hypothetical protein
MSQTLGYSRMDLGNPSHNEMVNKIKIQSAHLIDLIESMRTQGISGEKHRLLSHAQTEIESASMFAVKANFTH